MSASNPSIAVDSSDPKLTPTAQKRASSLSQTFQGDLVAASHLIARHGGFEYIDEPHVNDAMAMLRRAGLRRDLWFFQRPDFRVGIGGVLLGFGPTVASIAKDVIESRGRLSDHPVSMWVFMITLPFVICLAGGILAVWGWVQSDRG